MNKIKLEILCGFRSKIAVCGQEFLSYESGPPLTIEISSQERKVDLFVTPVFGDSGRLPYGLELDTCGGLSVSSNLAEVFEVYPGYYILELKPLNYLPRNSYNVIASELFSDGKKRLAKVTDDGGIFFEVESKDEKKGVFICEKASACELSGRSEAILLSVETENKKIISLYDGYCFKTVESDMAEIGETVKMLTYCEDIAHRGHVFERNRETLELIREYHVYLDGEPNRTQIARLYPLAFLESVKAEDFNEAMQYVSDDFKEKMNSNRFGFFGEIEKIFFVDTEKADFAIKNFGTNKLRLFDFRQESDGKIKDILEI